MSGASRPLDRAALVAAAVPAVAFALVLAATFGLMAATLDEPVRRQVWALIEPNVALVLMVWFFASLAAGVAMHGAWQRFAAAPARLAERVRVLLSAEAGSAPANAASPAAAASASPGGEGASGGPEGLSLLDAGESASAGSLALGAAVAALAMQRDALRREIAERVAEGSREVEQEKSRLAALMAELTQSVVVCNLDGRILLFNAKARLQFRALVAAPAAGAGAGAGAGSSGGASDAATGGATGATSGSGRSTEAGTA